MINYLSVRQIKMLKYLVIRLISQEEGISCHWMN